MTSDYHHQHHALTSSRNNNSKNHINNLPVELLVTVFELLAVITDSPGSIEVAGMVCRRWHAISHSDVLWSFVARRWVPALPLIRLVSSFEADQLEAKRQRMIEKQKKKAARRKKKLEEKEEKKKKENVNSAVATDFKKNGTEKEDEEEEEDDSSSSSSEDSDYCSNDGESSKEKKKNNKKKKNSFINRFIPPSTSPSPKELLEMAQQQQQQQQQKSSTSVIAPSAPAAVPSPFSDSTTSNIAVTSPNRNLPKSDSTYFGSTTSVIESNSNNNHHNHERTSSLAFLNNTEELTTPENGSNDNDPSSSSVIPRSSSSFGTLAAALYMQAHSNKQFTPPIAATPKNSSSYSTTVGATAASATPSSAQQESMMLLRQQQHSRTSSGMMMIGTSNSRRGNNNTSQRQQQTPTPPPPSSLWTRIMMLQDSTNNNNNNNGNNNSMLPRRLLQLVPRELVVGLHNERIDYIIQCQKYLLVEHQRRYTVNLFITFMLLSLTFCCLFFVIGLELLSLQSSPSSLESSSLESSQTTITEIIVSWLSSVFSIDASFSLLWLSVALGAGAVVTNIVMTAHFEPQPIIQRIMDHWQLIGASVFGLIIMMLVIFFPFYAIQENIKSCYGMVKERERNLSFSSSSSTSSTNNNNNLVEQWTELGCLRYSWVVGTMPIILALSVWQLTVLLKVREQLAQFFSLVGDRIERGHVILTLLNRSSNSNRQQQTDENQIQEQVIEEEEEFDELRDLWLTPTTFITAISYLTPMTIAIAVLLFAWYLETGNHFFLILSMAPFLVIVLILIVIFAIDYAVGGNLADGVAFVGLGLVCLAPVTAFVFPIRGLTGLPLVLTFGGAFLAYADKTLKLIKTVDDLGAVA